jgi:pimeloyl-ACP methyl ester carboxylesterase
MEPIDAGDTPLDEVVDKMFSRDGLDRLLRSYRTACFVLARSALQAKFYQELIQNIDTVDATTRGHIAFIVFYGNRSSYIDVRGDKNYRHFLNGLSISDRYDPHPHVGFAKDLRAKMKAEPLQAPFHEIGRATDFATTLLMERFDVRETSLPCLLFLEGSSTNQPQIVALSPSEPMKSLYKDVLAPLSDELRLLDRLNSRRREIASYILQSEECNKIVREFSSSYDAINHELNDVRSEIAQILASYREPSTEHLLIERENLETIHRTYKSAKTLEERIALALNGPDAPAIAELNQRLNDLVKDKIATQELTPSEDQEKRLHQLSSSIGRVRSWIGSLVTRHAAEAASRLAQIEAELRKIAQADDQVKSQRQREKELTNRRRDMQAIYDRALIVVREYSEATLENERRKVAETEDVLRQHGFSADVLKKAAGRISALEVVEVLNKTGKIGWRRSPEWTSSVRRPTPLSAAPEKGLLLFIHGLGGAREATWGKFPAFLKASQSVSDRYAIDYYSFLTQIMRLPFSSRAPKIQVLADGLRTQLKYAGYERVCLMCHSLGGLVAKQYLIEEIEANRELKVNSVAFFGVPNNGADLAAIGNLISWRQHQLKQLRKDADIIEFSNKAWRRLDVRSKVRLKYVVGSQDRVVNRLSAEEYWGNPDVETVVGCGHLDIVKPGSVDDLVVRMMRDFLVS